MEIDFESLFTASKIKDQDEPVTIPVQAYLNSTATVKLNYNNRQLKLYIPNFINLRKSLGCLYFGVLKSPDGVKIFASGLEHALETHNPDIKVYKRPFYIIGNTTQTSLNKTIKNMFPGATHITFTTLDAKQELYEVVLCQVKNP